MTEGRHLCRRDVAPSALSSSPFSLSSLLSSISSFLFFLFSISLTLTSLFYLSCSAILL